MTVSQISDKWRSAKLKDLPISIIDGDRSARYPKRSEFLPEGIPFLNTTNIELGRLILDNVNFVSHEKFSQIQKGRLHRLDIIMTTRGSIGKVALFDCAYPTGLINAQMLILRADSQSIDPAFLFYLTLGDRFQSLIRNFGSGSAQPQIPITALREIEISHPDIKAQRKIAAILAAYDDLIENNTGRIRILEEMAQMIYREWFVNFGFPGHEKVRMIDSELGKIPEGWEVSRLGHLVEFMKGKKPAETHSSLDEGDVPLLLIDVLQGGPVQYCKAKGIIRAERRDIIMVMDGASSGTVYTGFEGAVGSTLAKLRIRNRKQLSHHIVYHFLGMHKEDIRANNVGSAIPHANKDYINRLGLLIPPEGINLSVDEIMESNRLLIENLLQRNMCLRHTRDLLLPRLISGELDVSDLNIDTREELV